MRMQTITNDVTNRFGPGSLSRILRERRKESSTQQEPTTEVVLTQSNALREQDESEAASATEQIMRDAARRVNEANHR